MGAKLFLGLSKSTILITETLIAGSSWPVIYSRKEKIIGVFRIKMKLPGWQKLSGGSQETEQGKSRDLLGIWGSPVHLLEQHFYEEKQYFYIHKPYDSSFATKMYNCQEKMFVFLIFFFFKCKMEIWLSGSPVWSAVSSAQSQKGKLSPEVQRGSVVFPEATWVCACVSILR